MIRSVAGDGELEVVDVEARRRVGLKVGSLMVAVGCCCWGRADSGMRRKDIGSTLLPLAEGWFC